MKLNLLCIFFLFLFCNSSVAQAPAWQWAKEANSALAEQAWDVAYDNFSGNIYIGGTFNGNLSAVYGASLAATYGQSDGFVAKYDPLGVVIWAFKIGGTDVEEVKSIATDNLGNVYVTGYFRSVCDFDPSGSTFNLTPSGGAGNQDGFLAKYDSQGNFIWATKFGNNSAEDVWRMVVNTNGIYLTGSYSGNATFNSASPSVVTKVTSANQGGTEFFGAKYNLSGVVQWVVSGGSQQNDAGYDVIADNNNVYFIGDYNKDMNFYNANGTFTVQLNVASNNKTSAFIASYYESSGALNWVTSAGAINNDLHGGGITQDNSNLYITGSIAGIATFPIASPLFTQISLGNNDMFLAKLSKSNGVYQWVSPQTGIGTGDEAAYEVVCDASGNLVLAGYFTSSMTFTDGTTFLTLGNQDILLSSFNNSGNFLWAVRAGANGNDIPYGLTTNTTGGIYVAGEHDDATVFGPYTLTNGGSTNIFVAKTGCETASNNSIAISQTICLATTPATLSGSVPSSGSFFYKWEQSLDNTIWIPALGTNTTQNYSPPPLLVTTFYRRNVFSGSSCSNISNSNTVSITVSLNPDLSFAGSSQTVCINTATALLSGNVPTVGIGTWSVISGSGTVVTPTLATSGITNLGVGNNTLRWSIGNGCAVNNSTVVIRVDALPSGANAGTSQTICSSAATLSAASPTSGAGLWSVLAGTGTLSGTGSLTPAVSGISTGTNSFLWTVINGVCPSSTAIVSVYRDASPISNAGINQTICAVTSTLSAITQTFGTGLWSIVAGTSTLSNLNIASPNVSGISTGTNSFLWTVSNGVCPSSTAIVNIYRDASPIANAGINQTICAVTSTLSAITQTFGTGLWSVVAGTSTLSNLNIASPNVSGISTGTNTFLWTVTNGVCPSSTAVVNIYKDASPVANAGINQTICAVTSTLSAITQTFGIGLWSVVAGTSTLSNLNVASPNVSGISTGTNTFLWTVINGVCPSSTAIVNIYRDASPIANAGINQTICAVTSTLSAITQTFGTGLWSVVAGTSTLSNLNIASPNVSGISTGTNTFLWTVINGVCPSSTAIVNIYRDASPTANAGINQTICAVTSTLSAITQTFGTGLWSVVAGTSTLSNLNVASPNVSGISTGTNTFLWTVSNGVCPSSTAIVNIYRDASPIANAGINQTICAVTSTLSAITQTFGTGLWSVVAGTSTLSNLNIASPNVSGISTGTNTFLWTVNNGVCPSSTAIVNIYKDASPIANAGINQTICAVTSTLSAITQTFGTGLWSVVAGTSTLSNLNIASPNVSGISTGTNTFLWTVINGVCPSSTAIVNIYRDASPIANAGINQTICAVTSTLSAITQTFGTGLWSVVAGTSTLSNLNIASPNVSGISTGTNTFLWTVTNGVCPSSTAVVNIYKDASPVANAGINQTICAVTSTLSAITQTFGTGLWSVVAGTSTLSNLNIASPNVSGISTGTNTFLWTVINGVCPSSTAIVNIYRDASPVANAGINQTICAVTSTLSAITQTFGTGLWSVVAGTSTLSNLNVASPNVSGISTGTNTFLWTVINGVCPSSTAIVNIYRDASPIANAGINQTICAVTSTLSAITQTFGTGLWSVVAGTSTLSNLNIASPNVSGISTGTNTFLWTVNNGVCPSSTAIVNIYRDASPTANAGINQTICAVTSTLSAITQTFGTGLWSVVAGTSTLSNLNIASPNVSGISTGTNTFLWTVSNGVCPSSTAIVNIYRDASPIANAGINQTICAVTSTLSAITQTFGTGLWSVVAGTSTLSNLNIASPNVSGISTGTNTFLWTVNNGVCPSSTAIVNIYKDASPIANAGINQTICAVTSTLSAITQTFGTGLWSVVAGTSTLSNLNIASPNVSGISTGTNTFLWTVINGVCPSSTAIVNIYRDASPTANAGINQTICAVTSTLSAITQTFGTGLWSVIAGTSTLSNLNIASSNVSGISTGTNTFLWTVNNGVCPSSTAIVNIYKDASPVANAGINQTICAVTSTLSAITQTFGTGLWSVVAGTSTLSNLNIASPNVSGISTGTNTFLWTVSNGVCPSSTAIVNIYRDNLPSFANAGTNQTICTSTAILTASVQANSTGSWTAVGPAIVSSPNSTTTSVSGLITGTNNFVWNVVSGVCPASTATVSVFRDAVPSVANVGSGQTICSSTAAISAFPPAIGSGSWTTITGTAAVTSPTAANSLVSGINNGNNTFLWTVSNGVCPSSTAAVSLFRDVMPIANAGVNQTVCASTATLGGIIQTLGTGTWSLLTGSAFFLSTTSASAPVSSLGIGTNTLMWIFANGICPNATDTVEIFRYATPIANAGSDQTICISTSTLAPITQTFGIGTWSVIAGTSTLSSLSTPSAGVAGISTGTNTYLWSVSYGTCPTVTSSISIIRDVSPVANAGTDQTVCAVTASLNAIVTTPGVGSWSLVAGSGTISSNTSSTTLVSALNTGTNSFLWTVINGVCPSATAIVNVVRDVFPLVNAGTDQTICVGSSSLSAITQTFGSGSWSVLLGNATISNSFSAGTAVSGVSTGTNAFIWTYVNGVCPAVNDTVFIFRDVAPLANAGSNQTVCTNGTTLSALTQSFGTGTWSVLSGGSVLSSLNSSSTSVSGIANGINSFQWTVVNGVCPPSSDTVFVYRDISPSANAGSSQTICLSTSTLAAITQSFGTGTWSVITGGSTISAINSATTSVQGIGTGTNSYLWTVVNGVCAPSTSTVFIIRDAPPSPSNAGSDQVICSATISLSGSVPTIGSGSWSLISGTGVFNNVDVPTTMVSGISTGSNAFLWTVVNGVCPPSYDTVTVEVDAVPTIAHVDKDQEVCSNTATISANVPVTGVPYWRLISGGGIISDSTANVTSITSLSAGISVFRWNIKNGVCPVSFDEIKIVQDTLPSIASAGINQQVDKPIAQLSAATPSVGKGSWSVADGLGNIDDLLNPTTKITGLAVGSNTIRWTVVSGVCSASKSDIVIYVEALQIPTGFSPNGDGINDFYVVPGIDYYDDVKISVFNRWGGLVYHNTHYKNDWNGNNMNNEPLADDTYYYTIKISSEMSYSGYVIIKAAK